MTPSFANILFSGPCNLSCTFCIGKYLPPRPNNLDTFPLQNLSSFLEELSDRDIVQVSLTGTNTDPLLYRHGLRLVEAIRTALPRARINLHTNGRIAHRQLDFINACDRMALSIVSLSPTTARELTGQSSGLDLRRLVQEIRIPIKVSTVIMPANVGEIPTIIETCQTLGIKRLAFRKLVNPGQSAASGKLAEVARQFGPAIQRTFGQNLVYELPNLEITLWDFENSDLNCLNLFSDGTISRDYRLAS